MGFVLKLLIYPLASIQRKISWLYAAGFMHSAPSCALLEIFNSKQQVTQYDYYNIAFTLFTLF